LDLNPKRKVNSKCLAKGISLYEDFEDAISAIQHFTNIGKYIYSGIIRYRVDGIVQITKGNEPSHRTWYPYIETDEKSLFKDFKYER
jgi:hypothetical protein